MRDYTDRERPSAKFADRAVTPREPELCLPVPGLRTEVVAVYRGILRSVIKRMKYDGEVGWAPLFGRLLARRLEQVFRPETVDLVVPNPTHPSRAVRHTELILDECAAATSSAHWRFDDVGDPCLVKARVTPKSHGGDPGQRAASAEALYRSLVVARPELVRNRRLVVVDDVETTGQQLRAVQRKLLEGGATSVEALVLASPPAPEPGSAALGLLARTSTRPPTGLGL